MKFFRTKIVFKITKLMLRIRTTVFNNVDPCNYEKLKGSDVTMGWQRRALVIGILKT